MKRLHLSAAGAVVAMTLLVTACGAAQTSTTTYTHVRVVAYSTTSADASAQSPYLLTASASCRPGEQMLGGGFAATDVFEFDAYILASYPSGAATWTVSASSHSHFSLTTTVYCLQAGFSAGIQQVRGGTATPGEAACPSGSVLVGGGFRSSEPVGSSMPRDATWQASTSGSDVQVYAMCAASHVRLASQAPQPISLHATTNGYQPESFSTTCSAGQIAVGGFSAGGLVLVSVAEPPNFSAWSLEAGGSGPGDLVAECLEIG